ncbi:unnamed protein product [Paramecium sonneborni]|uniref:Uncharacterized protein n=1 Tax=Paramecium sonneborni TaxID=65129 RepID=A0A8S1KW14_9CILI|nr:unnamed protein product [Paramecium sonneborni]
MYDSRIISFALGILKLLCELLFIILFKHQGNQGKRTISKTDKKYLTIFLKHLIRIKILKRSELQTELQAFSIEFSNISETSSLFKLIKNDQKQ